MSLRDTDALIIEVDTAANSLPDPTTVAQRTHILNNTGSATVVWSSTGATPFTEGGVNVVTISVVPGAFKEVQSNGTRWVVTDIPFTGLALPSADFWRSGAGATLPDGITDFTDAIEHNGLTGIGAAFAAADPVAQLDVAFGARSGVDGRVPGVTPFYVTGTLPDLGAANISPPATPTGGVEFRHSNQLQGIGIGFNGLYATGSIANMPFNFINRGTGIFSFSHQTLNGGFNYTDWVGPTIAANQGWITRWWGGGTNEASDLIRRSTVGVGGTSGTDRYFQLRDAAGTVRNSVFIRPSVTQATAFSLVIDQDIVNDAKLVLFGDANTQFFGMGIKTATLASFISSNTGFFRWYAGASPGVEIFEIQGNGSVSVDPLATAVAGYTSPALLFGGVSGQANVAAIKSQKTVVDRFQHGLEFYTNGNNRVGAFLTGGRLYLAVVPTFATDALAGAGGLLAGEVYKDVFGALRIKL